jgi:hypothetical protein
MAVTGVDVRSSPPHPGPDCDGTALVTGTLGTQGSAGTASYRWRTSDGNTSGLLTQYVPGGSHTTEVVLRWTFHSPSSMQMTATLDIVGPTARSASVTFPYNCV